MGLLTHKHFQNEMSDDCLMDAATLTRYLSELDDRLSKQELVRTIFFSLACVPLIEICIFALYAMCHKQVSGNVYLTCHFLWATCICGCASYGSLFNTKRCILLLDKICCTDNLGHLYIILKAVKFDWAWKTDAIKHTLPRLLHLLNEDHIGVLNNIQQSQLWSNVFVGFKDWTRSTACVKSELALASLRAFSVIGNVDILRKMKVLAATCAHNSYQSTIIQVAAECTPLLEERLQRRKTPQTLLRPSASVTSPDTLLRPASGTKQQASEAEKQLLRSTSIEASLASNVDVTSLPILEFTTPQEPMQQVQLGQQAEEETP